MSALRYFALLATFAVACSGVSRSDVTDVTPPTSAAPPRAASAIVPTVVTPRVTAVDTKEGIEFTVQPAGVVVEVHDRMSRFSYRGPGLSGLRGCTMGWDREFSHVADAAVSFGSLVLQTGDDEFCEGYMFRDALVRLYVTEEPVEALAEAIPTKAAAAVAELRNARVLERKPEEEKDDRWTPRTDYPDWKYVPFGYSLNFGDYGGHVAMEYFLRRVGSHTVVLLFMYVGSPVYEADGVRVDPIASTVTSLRAVPSSTEPLSAEDARAQREVDTLITQVCACDTFDCVERHRKASERMRIGKADRGRIHGCIQRITMEEMEKHER